MEDNAIMDKWQALAAKKDPAASIYDDSVQMFLFSHFLEEDIDEAWACVPEHKDILKRLGELEAVMRGPDEVDGIPAYVCPSKHNRAEDAQIKEWIQSHLRNIAGVWVACVDSYGGDDEAQLCIEKFRSDFTITKVSTDCETSGELHEDICFFMEFLGDAILEGDVNRALYEYFTYLTKADDVTHFLLTPRILGVVGITEDTFEPGFRLWANNVEFDYGTEEGTIVYWLEND